VRVLILAAALALAGTPASAYELDEFMISLGWPTEVECPDDDALARAMAEAGINTVMWDLPKLELCREYGLRLSVYHGEVVSEGAVSEEQLAAWQSQPAWPKGVPPLTTSLIQSILGDPAIWGYHIFDEPTEEQFPFYAKAVAEFHEADPRRPAYINLYSSGGDYLSRFMDVVQPRILSYDYYQWWWGRERHFQCLKEYRRAALQAGIPLVCWVEVNAGEAEQDSAALPPEDNAQKLRQSVYTSLAYGVKGIEWFTASILFRHGTAELQLCGADVAALNAELAHLGPVLVNLRSTDVFHTEPVAAGCRPIPEGYGIRSDTPGLVVGIFEPRDDDEFDYILVANRSIEERRDVRLRLDRRPSKVIKLRKTDGRRVRVPIRRVGEGSELRLSLAPGDGELLRLRPGIIEADRGTEPAEDAPLLLDDGPLLLLDDGPAGEQEIADNSRCHVCHLNYMQEDIAVLHARAGMGCADCHGDCDEHIADESWAEGGNGTAPGIMYRREEVNPFCYGCHAGDEIDQVLHESFLAETAEEKHCTDCHGEHRLAVRNLKWK